MARTPVFTVIEGVSNNFSSPAMKTLERRRYIFAMLYFAIFCSHWNLFLGTKDNSQNLKKTKTHKIFMVQSWKHLIV